MGMTDTVMGSRVVETGVESFVPKINPQFKLPVSSKPSVEETSTTTVYTTEATPVAPSVEMAASSSVTARAVPNVRSPEESSESQDSSAVYAVNPEVLADIPLVTETCVPSATIMACPN